MGEHQHDQDHQITRTQSGQVTPQVSPRPPDHQSGNLHGLPPPIQSVIKFNGEPIDVDLERVSSISQLRQQVASCLGIGEERLAISSADGSFTAPAPWCAHFVRTENMPLGFAKDGQTYTVTVSERTLGEIVLEHHRRAGPDNQVRPGTWQVDAVRQETLAARRPQPGDQPQPGFALGEKTPEHWPESPSFFVDALPSAAIQDVLQQPEDASLQSDDQSDDQSDVQKDDQSNLRMSGSTPASRAPVQSGHQSSDLEIECPSSPAPMMQEKRYSIDGCAYSRTEFIDFFGQKQGPRAWAQAQPAPKCEQDCVQSVDPAQRDHLADLPISGNVWKLSVDKEGCRRVQDAFENASEEQCRVLAKELEGNIWEAQKHPNANHVVQKCIESMTPEAVQFIIDEISQGGSCAWKKVAESRFGCRIIQRLIEHPGKGLPPLVNELLDHAVTLSSHDYGKFVMKHLLEHGGNDVSSRLTSILCYHVPFLTGKVLAGNAGDVIGMALSLHEPPTPENAPSQGTLQWMLANALLRDNLSQDPDRLITMARSRYGAPALSQAFKIADGDGRLACYTFQLHWDKLCADGDGRRYFRQNFPAFAGQYKRQ